MADIFDELMDEFKGSNHVTPPVLHFVFEEHHKFPMIELHAVSTGPIMLPENEKVQLTWSGDIDQINWLIDMLTKARERMIP